MTDEQYLKEWFSKASDDLKIIRQAMDRPDSDWVTGIICFHAQQAAEKALKAYLIFREQNPQRTHSLEILYEQIRVVEPSFPTYDFADLTTFAVQVRYPGEAYVPSGDETVEYVQLANLVVSDLRQLVFSGLSARSSKRPESKVRDDR